VKLETQYRVGMRYQIKREAPDMIFGINPTSSFKLVENIFSLTVLYKTGKRNW
jgi:hypothetical protein